MKTLIIITKSYPYAKTEAFLESEIKVLSKCFEKIIVCPTFFNEFKRETPDNVYIDNSFLINRRLKIKVTFIAFVKGLIFKYFFDHLFKIKSINDLKSIIRYAAYEVHYGKQIKASNTDFEGTIIYSYWFSQAVNALQLYRRKNNFNFKLITRAHRWDIYEDMGMFPYRKKTIESIDYLFSISMHGKNYIQQRYGNNEKIEVSRLGIFDHDVLSGVSKDNKFVVLTVAQITSRKRPFLVLDSIIAFAEKNKNINVKWVHFGSGNLEEELKSKIKGLAVSNLEISLKGYVLNTDIYEFYKSRNIDVFMNLSESEGVPVSIMEAQSFGIPVIATDVGGTSEIVFDSVGVLLKASPVKNEVLDALCYINVSKLSRTLIKKSWNEKSNAQINYTNFVKRLIKL